MFIILYLYIVNKVKVKKIVLISTIIVYMLLNIGISMKIHYCGDTIDFVDFFALSEKTCCEGIKKPSCCSDKVAFITPGSLQDNLRITVITFTNYAKFNLVKNDFTFLSELETQKADPEKVGFYVDFKYQKVPLYILNEVFRI